MPGGGPGLPDHRHMNERRLFANPGVALLVVWHPLQTGIWEFSFPFLPISHSFATPQLLTFLSALWGPSLSCSCGSTRELGISSPPTSGEDAVRTTGPEPGCGALPGQPRSGLLTLFHLSSTPDMSVRWRSKKGRAGEENHLVLPSSWGAGGCSL